MSMQHKHIEYDFEETIIRLGSSEVWIPGDNNFVYVSPDLIIHYMAEHCYQPPEAYLRAVENYKIPD